MANIIPPLVNGASYEWSDITLTVMNVPIVGITEIEYADMQNSQNIYGAGSMPVSRGLGSVETTGSITLKMEEVENIMSIAPGGNLRSIPEFDIIVAYIDTSKTVRKHKIRNCRFKNNNRTTKQGDTSIDVKLELLVSHIEWV